MTLLLAAKASLKTLLNQAGGWIDFGPHTDPDHFFNQEKTMSNPEEKPKDDFEAKAAATQAAQLPAADEPNYDDLPEELKKQLIGYDDIELENQLFDVVKTMTKSVITVDKVMVAMYHRHKKVVDRNKVLRTLNAMAIAGRIQKHASPRGYSLPVAGGANE